MEQTPPTRPHARRGYVTPMRGPQRRQQEKRQARMQSGSSSWKYQVRYKENENNTQSRGLRIRDGVETRQPDHSASLAYAPKKESKKEYHVKGRSRDTI
jgi:hypothetical protein